MEAIKRRRDEYLRATKTLRALVAASPKTFLKNSAETVTPLWRISSLLAALKNINVCQVFVLTTKGRYDERKVRHVCK